MKCLVIVDMQNDFVSGSLGTKQAQSIVDKIYSFASIFSGDIYFTRDTHQKDYLNTMEGKNLPIVHTIENTKGWEIVDKLKTIANKSNIINKPTFGSIELANTLKNKKYDEIYFCGVCTGICVISNAILTKTLLPESKIVVLKDLCACVSEQSHNNAIEAMKLLQINIQ